MHPRCRWRIGCEGDFEGVEPYRLLVSLVENRRINGKVRQEHVADLGAIDGHLLSGFFAGIDPAIVEKMKAPDWRLFSLRARATFWRHCLDVMMERLGNRLSADEAKRLRQVIHARVPYVLKLERQQLEAMEYLRDAELAFKTVQDMFVWADKDIANANEAIARANAEIEEANAEKAKLGPASMEQAELVLKAKERLKRLE